MHTKKSAAEMIKPPRTHDCCGSGAGHAMQLGACGFTGSRVLHAPSRARACAIHGAGAHGIAFFVKYIINE